MSIFEDRQLLTPFGYAVCGERVDYPDTSFWICWIKETQICFWFPNTEVRLCPDWSDGRYKPLPFQLSSSRIETLDSLGKHHSYWRENINQPVPHPERHMTAQWRRYTENDEGVHLQIGEFTLCGDAFDIDAVEKDRPPFRATRSVTVTCKRCRSLILTCRGVRVAPLEGKRES